MLTEREQAIKNVLMDHLGGAPNSGSGKAMSRIDPEYLQMAARRMTVNRRRMIIFAALYGFVLLTAVTVMILTARNYSVLLWVGAGTFNAVNAAIHYAEYRKKKMAFDVLEVLEQDEG